MVGTRKATLRLSPYNSQSEIIIDGTNIAKAVQSIVLKASAGDISQLQLNLQTLLVEIDGEVQFSIPAATHNALVELGWTPPVDAAVTK